MIIGTANNPTKVSVDFPFYAGTVKMPEGFKFAYSGKRAPVLPMSGTIDGQSFNVIKAVMSEITENMIVVTVEPIAP